MENLSCIESDDPFADSDEWIAAQARQLFRALQAEDPKAVEVSLFYFQDFLVKTLGRHLRDDPRWDSSHWWLDGLVETAPPDAQPPGRLHLRSELMWATRDQANWYTDPFEFELELYPRTGAFRRYTFRFGDHRPLTEKRVGASAGRNLVQSRDENTTWAFVFRRPNPGAPELEKGSGVVVP